MAQTIIDLLNKSAEANNADKFCRGSLVSLPAQGSLIVTGDLHGHRRNFERILSYADLANNPDRHILLQEIIHGGPQDSRQGCLSYKLLFDAARLKLDFPDRVHIIMGNHDTAFISDSSVMKDGQEMNLSMRLALEREYGTNSAEISLAIKQFLLSQPLAVRCQNRIWLSHSLPDDRHGEQFDRQIIDRKLQEEDCKRPGSAYLFTWGRKHSQSLLNKMAELLDADIFILGHQTQKLGWAKAGDNLVILASEHNHGSLMPIDLSKSYTIDQLIDSIVPLASIQ